MSQDQMDSSKNGSAMSGIKRIKTGSQGKPGTGQSVKGSKKFDRVLSSKAIQIGHESGITAEFICKQTAEQTVYKLNDLFTIFDIMQSSLYSNDPEMNKDQQKRSTM